MAGVDDSPPRREDPTAPLSAETRALLAALVAAPTASVALAQVPAIFDGLHIVRRLGRGGMGDVFLAEEPALARQVAVKVLRGAAGEEWLSEARVIGGLHYPGIVALHRVGVVVGRPYLVYELVPGVPLSRATMPMPMRRMLAIGRDLASALTAVHAAGIVHADIKPSNVMLAPDPVRPGAELTKLIDFGIAHRENGRAYVGFGTPLYMAPEVRQRGAATAKSDTYSLALVLIEMLTGAPDPNGLSELRANNASVGSVELFDALAQTLSPDPARRLGAKELFLVLEPGTRAPAVAAAPPPPKPEVDPFAAAGVDAHNLVQTASGPSYQQSIWLPGGSLMCVRQNGILDATAAKAIVHASETLVARGQRPCVFIDARRVVDETTEYIRAINAWSHSLPVLSELHLLGRSGRDVYRRARVHAGVAGFGAALRRAVAWAKPIA